MHALSIKQPFAERIASGSKKREYRTWAAHGIVGRDLLIVASRSRAEGAGTLPTGVAICVVRVVAMRDHVDGFAWVLEDPRRVKPTPIVGRAALFHVPDETIGFFESTWIRGSIVSTRETARRAPKAPRVKRAVKLPYTFAIGDDPIDAAERYPGDARERARDLAARHGQPITILRDGFAVSIVEP